MKRSKICIDCKERKKLEDFPNQVKYNYVKNTSNRGRKRTSDGRRNDCKKCHQKKTIKAYKKRTTAEERRTYMREYMRKYYKSHHR